MHAPPRAVRGDLVPQGHSDPLARFTEHRRYNRPIAMPLYMDDETVSIGQAIANCARLLAIEVPLDHEAAGTPLLRQAHLCNKRLCPFCEWRRVRALRTRILRGMDGFHAVHPKHRGVLLTLTVRNCPLDQLGDTISELHRAFARMTRCSFWPTPFYLRRTEVTVKREPQAPLTESHQLHATRSAGSDQASPTLPRGRIASVHPHLHVLLLVPPSYFSTGYVKQLEWQRQWQMAARLDYTPVVDVRSAKVKAADQTLTRNGNVGAVLEAAKYTTKATDLLALGTDIAEFHRQVKCKRLFSASRQLSQFIKDADPTSEELLDTEQPSDPQISPSLFLAARWCDELQEYNIVP